MYGVPPVKCGTRPTALIPALHLELSSKETVKSKLQQLKAQTQDLELQLNQTKDALQSVRADNAILERELKVFVYAVGVLLTLLSHDRHLKNGSISKTHSTILKCPSASFPKKTVHKRVSLKKFV